MLELADWALKHIRQGHCKSCNSEIWNIFDVKECYNCKIDKKLRENNDRKTTIQN